MPSPLQGAEPRSVGRRGPVAQGRSTRSAMSTCHYPIGMWAGVSSHPGDSRERGAPCRPRREMDKITESRECTSDQKPPRRLAFRTRPAARLGVDRRRGCRGGCLRPPPPGFELHATSDPSPNRHCGRHRDARRVRCESAARQLPRESNGTDGSASRHKDFLNARVGSLANRVFESGRAVRNFARPRSWWACGRRDSPLAARGFAMKSDSRRG